MTSLATMILLIPLQSILSHGLSEVEFYTDRDFIQMVEDKSL